jgi:hypothetical protein
MIASGVTCALAAQTTVISARVVIKNLVVLILIAF